MWNCRSDFSGWKRWCVAGRATQALHRWMENAPLVLTVIYVFPLSFVFKLGAISEMCFAAYSSVFSYAKVSVRMCGRWRTILIASCQGQRLRRAMRGMSGGLRLQCLQPTPESRAHCVAAEGEQRHFHWRNFGFLSIRRAALWARAVFICLSTVGIYAAAEARTFQTTSGGCINSQRNIKGREKIPPDDQDSQLSDELWLFISVWGFRFVFSNKTWSQTWLSTQQETLLRNMMSSFRTITRGPPLD